MSEVKYCPNCDTDYIYYHDWICPKCSDWLKEDHNKSL